MTLQVVWSAQARSQLIATLTYIAKDDPHSAAFTHIT
jgi:plasmid stabilization system protein ParE